MWFATVNSLWGELYFDSCKVVIRVDIRVSSDLNVVNGSVVGVGNGDVINLILTEMLDRRSPCFLFMR